jgi:hypothetical protein
MCIEHIAPETPANNMELAISPLINEEEVYELYQPYNIDNNVNDYENDNMHSLYIECLADSGTTSHIFNNHDAFSDLEPIDNIFISGVRGTKTRANGQGTVTLIAENSTGTCTIKLRNALYVPSCKHNLISLGRWKELG